MGPLSLDMKDINLETYPINTQMQMGNLAKAQQMAQLYILYMCA